MSDKEAYIKVWKQELSNLRLMLCDTEHRKQLDFHIAAIDILIEQIAKTKDLE